MTEDEHQQVDLRLQWEDSGKRRDQSADSVAVGLVEDEEGVSQELDAEPAEVNLEEVPDDFEWDADREQALLDALEETVEGSSPLIHRYIESVMIGLRAETMSADEARATLSEIQDYLTDNIDWEQSKPPVDHPEFMQSREDKLNALFAWRESAGALTEYLDNREEVQLKVAVYAAEQGKSFLEQSLDLLMSCEPLEDEDNEDWDEDSEAPSMQKASRYHEAFSLAESEGFEPP